MYLGQLFGKTDVSHKSTYSLFVEGFSITNSFKKYIGTKY